MRLNHIAVAAAVAVSLSPLPALADSQRLTTTIRYNDLNLADAAGRSKLESRLLAAAKYVCAVNESQGPLAIKMHERRCLRATLANTRPAVETAVSRATGAAVNVAAAGSWE